MCVRPPGGLLLALVLAACASTAGAEGTRRANCAWRVCVEHRDTPTGRTYLATNDEPVPVTVVLTFRSVDNLYRPTDPVEQVVPRESTTTLVHLRAVDPGDRVGARASIAIDLGASDTEPDESSVYRAPFGGTRPRTLVQAYDSTGTHLGGMRYSLDFVMPEGTPVVAARSGSVLYLQDGFTRGGADPRLLERANLVVVAHSDGTMASYGHLSPGVEVQVGDSVSTGQLLGYSGATGFAGRPHLHFHVGVRMLGDPGRTIPIELEDGRGRPVALRVGSSIEPAPITLR